MSSLVLVVAFCVVVFILLMKSSSSPNSSTADRPTAVKNKADQVVPTSTPASTPPVLPQFDQSNPGEGHLYTIKGHHAHHHAGKYLSMTVGSYAGIPEYTVFLSDTKLSGPPREGRNATSEWHFKWHARLVRMVGRGTSDASTEGLALYKEGTQLKLRFLDSHHQH